MPNKTFAYIALLGVLLFSLPVFGQVTTLPTTTTTAAISATDKIVCLTSGALVNVPGVGTLGTNLYIDSEVIPVRSVTDASANCFNVTRELRPVGHVSGAVVYLVTGNQFYGYNPAGTCTLASVAVHPWINNQTGVISACQNGLWVPQIYTPKPVVAVAALPTCNAVSEGATAAVNNALTPVALSPVAGSGAVHVSVFCNGSAWLVQ